MKIRAGGGSLRAGGGALGQQGAPPCYSSLWETLGNIIDINRICDKYKILMIWHNSFTRKKPAHNIYPAKGVEDFNC